jgi:hypothetical protein
MKIRSRFAVAVAVLLYGGSGMCQGLAPAEPEAAPVPATVTAAERAAVDAPPAAVIAPTDAAPAGQSQADAIAAQPPSTEAAAVPTGKEAKPAASDDDAVICKQVEVFGSRVRRGKLCRTKKEWEMEAQSAKDFSKAIQKGSATQPRDVGGT